MKVSDIVEVVFKVINFTRKTARWFVNGSVAWLTLRPGSRPRRVARLALLNTRNWVLLRPRIKASMLLILERLPLLEAWIRRFHVTNPLHAEMSPDIATEDYRSIPLNHTLPDESMQQLTPRARKIYYDLKLAIERYENRDR